MIDRDYSVDLLLHEYKPLGDAVRPLADLARENPGMLDDVIRFAMALGIRAADQKWEKTQTPAKDRRVEDKPRLAWPDRADASREG